MIAEIDRARDAGDTMGGSFEVIAHDVPPGLGSYVQWDRKLDGRLGPGADVDSRDQGGRHRPRTAGGLAAGVAHSRRDSAPGRRRAERHRRA